MILTHMSNSQDLQTQDRYKIIISDCHLSAGRFFEGRLNPHEDFHFDEQMVDLFEYFSTGKFGVVAGQPVEVELIIGGDFFDFLNVPYEGEFDDVVTEAMSLYKTDAVLNGHPKVMDALRRFASQPGKKITYLVGNHDADLFFESVREKITRRWDPNGQYPSAKVELVCDRDRLTFSEGFEFRHGNQLEAGNELDFERPYVINRRGEKVLTMPWGSTLVLKIVNRLRWERDYLDKVRPIKAFVLFGLVMDTWFTLRYIFLIAFYFLKTKIFSPAHKRVGMKHLAEIFKQETKVFRDLESEARHILNDRPDLTTIIFGHTHSPMDRIYPDGKQYINTGTWTKMINLDWRGLGQQYKRTFAFIRISDGVAHCELRHWIGEHAPHMTFGS